MIDRAVIGTALPDVVATIERGQLRAFARAIGETDPVYSDLEAAHQAGHTELPVPPTFVFGLADGDGLRWLADLGIDTRAVLHGEQSFEYHDIAHAGDTLRLSAQIADVYAKKGGALQFVVRETVVRRQDGSPIADLRETLVIRAIAP